MSRLTGKCDFYDEVEMIGIDMSNADISIGDEHIGKVKPKDYSFLYPFVVVSACYSKAAGSIVHLTKEPWIDIEEHQMVGSYLADEIFQNDVWTNPVQTRFVNELDKVIKRTEAKKAYDELVNKAAKGIYKAWEYTAFVEKYMPYFHIDRCAGQREDWFKMVDGIKHKPYWARKIFTRLYKQIKEYDEQIELFDAFEGSKITNFVRK